MYKNYYLFQKIQAFKNSKNSKQDLKIDSVKSSIDSTRKSTLQERYKKIDIDSNSKISHAEVIKVIDSFFAGNPQLKIEDITDLVDFYFEQ